MAAHLPDTIQVQLAAHDSGYSSPQHGNQLRNLTAGERSDQLPDSVSLIPLYVDQKHVGGIVSHLQGDLSQQVRVDPPNADHEEAPQPDRKQDHPGLIAWSGQAHHRVPQWERRGHPQGPDCAHQSQPDEVKDDRDPGEAPADPEANLQRRGLPRGQANQASRRRDEHAQADPIDSHRGS